MAFQTSVAAQQSPGIEGGFYGANPHFTLTNPDEGMWVAGSAGVTIGQFAWANTASGQVTSAHPGVTTVRYGFVHRDQPAVIAGLLVGSSNTVVGGQGIDLLEDGPVWGRFAGGASIGQKVYAAYADGALSAAATASASTVTRSVTTTNTSTAISYTGGAIYAGQPVSGTGIPAGAYIVSVNAGAGTAVLSAAATASATVTGTFTTNFETAWTVRSTAGAGELAKLSVRG
ncbi:hypothetical protein [Novosphingobium colocasiae]|uniref:structural cement protein Gp24 n=1 Tax=Novosphingobium colocasiae TaxID=1256513 RepID=UPI0035B1DA6C